MSREAIQSCSQTDLTPYSVRRGDGALCRTEPLCALLTVRVLTNCKGVSGSVSTDSYQCSVTSIDMQTACRLPPVKYYTLNSPGVRREAASAGRAACVLNKVYVHVVQKAIQIDLRKERNVKRKEKQTKKEEYYSLAIPSPC